LSKQQIRVPGTPLPLTNILGSFLNASGRRHQQGKRQIGCGLGQNARRMSNRNAPMRAFGHIDMIDPHGQTANHPKPFSEKDDLSIDSVGQQAI